MKKWIFFTLALVLAMFLCFAGYLFVYRARFTANILSQTLQVPVSIKAIDILKNGLAIKGFRIQNPPGCALKNALTVDKIDVRMDWINIIKAATGLNAGDIVIDQIKIDKPSMSVELFSVTGSDSNWSRILSKISSTNSEPSSRGFEIKKLTLNEIQLEVKSQAIAALELKPTTIAKIELKDLGSNKPVATKELFLTVSTVLVTEAAKQLHLTEMLPRYINNKLQLPQTSDIEEFGNKLKELFKKGQDNE